MLQVTSGQRLDAIEASLRRAAHRYEASLLAVAPIGHLLREKELPGDAIVFTVCHPGLYAGLLAAELRMAAFLPCRIAACWDGARLTLETISPLEFCRLLNRMDLSQLAGPLEALLLRIMEEAAAPLEAVHAVHPMQRAGLGATEEQVNLRGSIPQRIDCRGTKVEEIAGTGEHDSKGG